jgi:hypothetical protein
MHDALWNKHQILTAYVPHEEYTGLRVTPNIYTTVGEVDRFADMVEREVKA